MQFWNKLGPAGKIAGILAILAGLFLVLRPGPAPEVDVAAVTPEAEVPATNEEPAAESVVAAPPEPVEDAIVDRQPQPEEQVEESPGVAEAEEPEEIAERNEAAEADTNGASPEVEKEETAAAADEAEIAGSGNPADVQETTETAEASGVVESQTTAESTEAAERTVPAEEEQPVAEATPEPEPVAEPAVVPEPQPIEPAFDVVRIAPDGNSLVAGQAEPGATVSVQLSGTTLAEVTADAAGKFVAFFDLPPSEAARALTLSATLDNGAKVDSNDIVFVLPNQVATPEPEVAAVEEEPTQTEESAEESTETAEAPNTVEGPETVEEMEPAPSAPTIVVATDEGVEVVQSGADTDPALQDTVMIEVISYSETGDVELGGRAAAGSFVRLYLNNENIGGVRADDAGKWAGTFADIAPGLYTLRADMVAEDGKVASRFETPFQRVDREVVAALLEEPTETSEPKPADDSTTDKEAEETLQVERSDEEIAVPRTEETRQTAETAVAEQASAEPVATEPVAAERPQPVVPSGPITVTVQPGNTLWAIAKENYGDGLKYVEVFQANRDKIRNPDLIYPGQIFDVPPKN